MVIRMSTRKERGKFLRNRVEYWSERLKVEPQLIRVQRMTRKWGSCSISGIVTLAEDLADQDTDFQDYVIVHELLHLRVPDHGRVFKALLSVHMPDWRKHEAGSQGAVSKPA